jgi:hypothetical protein
VSLDQTGYRNTFPLTKVLDRLYLGGFKDAEDLRSGNPLNITHICNCTTEPLSLPSRCVANIIQMDQLDGHEWHVQKLYSAVDWIRRALLGGGTVLVHCHAGISRSPVLVAAYLYTCGFDFDRALDRIKTQRPIVQPAPAVMISAKRAFGISPLAIHTTGR